MFYVIEQNNDLLVLKQWKCALNYPTLRARSVFAKASKIRLIIPYMYTE